MIDHISDGLVTNRFLTILIVVTGILVFGIEFYTELYEKYIHIKPTIILLFVPIPIALAIEHLLQSRKK